LRTSYKDTLKEIKSGKIDDAVTEVLKKVAKEVSVKYSK
jgi:F-type H+-transporting ATPase subunit alpha